MSKLPVIYCLAFLLIFCSSCSGCVINNRIEASGGLYTESDDNLTRHSPDRDKY